MALEHPCAIDMTGAGAAVTAEMMSAMRAAAGIPLSDLPGAEICSSYYAADGINVMKARARFDPHPWSETAVAETWGLILVRTGAYARRTNGDERVIDATIGVIRKPGDEIAYRHFLRPPDELTIIDFAPHALEAVPTLMDAPPAFQIDARADLTHRFLARSLDDHPRGAASHGKHEEAVIQFVEHLVGHETQRTRSVRLSARRFRHHLVRDACELLHADRGQVSLVEIGRRLGCSPYHLSRVFREIVGMTVTQYRQRLRVNCALDSIARGDGDLSTVAAASGFSDHPHMTRSIFAIVGHVPSELRRLLRASA